MKKSQNSKTSFRDEYIEEVTIGEFKPHNAKINLEAYNSLWPSLFEQESTRIKRLLGSKVIQIEHVGSTSVPGLCAKPIIDIILVVDDSSAEDDYIFDLESAGYILRIREPKWFEHRLLKGPDTDINLHVFSKGTSEIENMLVFRDWLRKHPDDRDKYALVKQSLSKHVWKSIQNYADAKSDIVREIMERAKKGSL